MRRFFQLERAVALLLQATPAQKARFVKRLQRVGIVITSEALRDARIGVVVLRHD